MKSEKILQPDEIHFQSHTQQDKVMSAVSSQHSSENGQAWR